MRDLRSEAKDSAWQDGLAAWYLVSSLLLTDYLLIQLKALLGFA